jgi:hypothetical protein
MNHRVRLIVFSWAFSLASLLSVAAQAPASIPVPTPPVASKDQITYQAPFSQFMSQDEQVILRNTSGSYTITIPVADRLEIQSAVFHLEYTSSINLLDERSQLAVTLNGQNIAQLPLLHAQPDGVVDIRLPTTLLKRGFNRLTVAAVQHYSLKCEDPTAPELWTQINTVRSTFSFQGRLLPLNGKLSQLGLLFDRKSWGHQKLNVVIADNEIDSGLKWGALAAEGVALRLQYAPLEVSRSAVIVPNADNIVIGTAGEISSLLGTAPPEEIAGSYIGLMQLPSDPNHCALILSGRTPEEVDRAVSTLCEINFPFPDSPSMVVQDMKFPAYLPYQGQLVAKEDTSYHFSDLGFKTNTIQGWTHGDAPYYFQFELNLPPDIYAPEMSQIEFRLHFAHGAGLRADSVFNLTVNDTFEDAIYLNDVNGASYQGYKIEVPLRNFKPGPNIVRLTPAMVPLLSDFCEIIQQQNLLLTLFDDSVVKLPPASHFTRLPDLQLFNETIFPLVSKPGGADLAVQVTARDSATLSAAWTLLAKLAQKAGVPLNAAEVSFEQGSTDRNLVVIGAASQIPAEVMQAAPFNLGTTNKVAYEQPLLRPLVEKTAYSPNGMRADVEGTGGLGTLGVAMQFRSPYTDSKSVFLFTADNPDLLLQRTKQLISPSVWSSLQGDVCAWNDGDTVASAQMIGPTYDVGSVSVNARMDYYVSRNPFYFIVGVLALLAILAFVIRRILNRHKLHHHGKEESFDAR